MTHEAIYMIFRCPNDHHSIEICAFGRFKCKKCNNVFSPNQAEIELINDEAAKDLQKSGVTFYRLIPDLLFANAIVRQNSDLKNTNPREEIIGTAQSNRIILIETNKKEQVEIFRGSNFSEEDFQKKPRRSN